MPQLQPARVARWADLRGQDQGNRNPALLAMRLEKPGNAPAFFLHSRRRRRWANSPEPGRHNLLGRMAKRSLLEGPSHIWRSLLRRHLGSAFQRAASVALRPQIKRVLFRYISSCTDCHNGVELIAKRYVRKCDCDGPRPDGARRFRR